jgi:repressor LexA
MQQERPTKKQRELLSFIDGFIKGNGYGPSYREIMRALDYKSVSTVATHIDGLIARGWLIKRDNSARTLEVVAPRAETTTGQTVGVIATPAEQALLAKIEELELAGAKKHSGDIETLKRALSLLGYQTSDTTHIV